MAKLVPSETCDKCGGDFDGKSWYVNTKWLCEPCVLKTQKYGDKITDEIVVKICEGIRKGLAIKDACAKAGVGESTFTAYIDGDTPRRPDWKLQKDQAAAEVIEHYIENMESAGKSDKGVAGVTAAKHMLYALDNRFRDDRRVIGDGLQVNIFVGEPEKEVRVIQSEVVRRVLPEGSGD